MAIAPSHAPPDTARWNALRLSLAWLAHPVSVIAIVVLVLNDHLLKSAHGTWWTGKLSDVAGLVFFPALVAVLLAAALPKARFRTLAATSIGASLAGFVWVKATATGAAAASAAWGLVVPGSVVLRDPTDLLALPMLGLAWALATRVARHTRHRSAGTRRRAQALVVLPFAVVATAATAKYSDSEYVMADIAVVDSRFVLMFDDHYSPSNSESDHREYLTSRDGTNFRYAESYAHTHLGEVFDAKDTDEACVPSEPTTCYRPMAGAVGVEVSHDGGATWETEWQVPEMSRQRLCEASLLASASNCTFVTRSVAVWESGGDYQVYAVNYLDNLAVRGADGTWTRMTTDNYFRLWDRDEIYVLSEDRVRELPPDEPWPPKPPVEALGLWSVTGAILAIAGGLWVLGRLREPQPGDARGAVVLGTIGLGLLVLAHAVQIVGTVEAPRPSELAGAMVFLLMAGAMPVLLAAGITRWAARPAVESVVESAAPSPGPTFMPQP
ncbi:MAG: hypothetical protein CVT64_11375 [Actinobacteria bacterium HGW-Actinobacteria-4]|nr:MAG: hypothetical protein CVT64_11375 [Actinobacteria bacterium HGW-Actinobacteria-4]